MSFTRGLDLSGTMQGAGGVGGLLAVSFKTNGTHFAAFDGNGNVSALVSAADGTTSANYEYDPFGQTIRITGTVGKLNPIRFSTQFADDVTGRIKYLHREYTPSTGNFLNHDPIGERGGLNLYGFVGNNPISALDVLGMDSGSTELGGAWSMFGYSFYGDQGANITISPALIEQAKQSPQMSKLLNDQLDGKLRGVLKCCSSGNTHQSVHNESFTFPRSRQHG